MQKTAMGVLDWTPPVFWGATPHEFYAAITGLNEKNGGYSGLTEEQVADLIRLKNEAMDVH